MLWVQTNLFVQISGRVCVTKTVDQGAIASLVKPKTYKIGISVFLLALSIKSDNAKQGRTQKFLKGGGLNFSKGNQYPIVVNAVIVKQGFAVIVTSLQHLFVPKPCNNDFESCWL